AGDPPRHREDLTEFKRREEECAGRPTAPIITRYRCFLPDLAGLAGLRRVGPGTRTSLPSSDVFAPTAKFTRSALHILPPMVRNLFLLAAVAAPPLAYAARVPVRVSPEVTTGIEGTREFRTIVQAMDHHPFATTNPD